VVVRATDAEIQQATEHMLFSELPEDIERVYTCPVSHDSFHDNSEITRICHCGHYFGREAIMRWFTMNVHCPICRFDIRNTSVSNTADEEDQADEEPTNGIFYEVDVMY
jgi:hypothetical protein